MRDAFIQYLEEQVSNHSIYVWGGQGEKVPTVSESWIRRKETTKKNADRAIAYFHKQVRAGYGNLLRAFDCSGLGTYFLIKEGLIRGDVTADGLYRACAPIQRSELKAGDFLFRINQSGRAYHVGYVVDDGRMLIEARGRDIGVVKRAVGNWDAFGRPPYFDTKPGKAIARLLRVKSPYLRGEDVRLLQRALADRGFDPGSADGIFGKATEKAVQRFQIHEKLASDGIAGRDTVRALGLIWAG